MAEIYGLFDASGGLRYIGKANNSAKRLSGHMRDARRRRTPVYDWINKHGRPEMRVLHICRDGEDWRVIEKRLIAEARARGERLLNLAEGGDEPFCSAEVRRKNGIQLNARMASGLKADGTPYSNEEVVLYAYKSVIKFYLNCGRIAKARESLLRLKEKHGSLPLVQKEIEGVQKWVA